MKDGKLKFGNFAGNVRFCELSIITDLSGTTHTWMYMEKPHEEYSTVGVRLKEEDLINLKNFLIEVLDNPNEKE